MFCSEYCRSHEAVWTKKKRKGKLKIKLQNWRYSGGATHDGGRVVITGRQEWIKIENDYNL